MKIVKWIERADGSFVWAMDERILGSVYVVDGVWRASWFGEPYWHQSQRMLSDNFLSAHDACLAAEKSWPPRDKHFGGWLESKNGGYFRKFTNKRTVYVRKADDGWYAIQTDGKFLGKGENVSWFTTNVDACRAVEKDTYTPRDADPFVNTHNQWRWVKFRNTRRAA